MYCNGSICAANTTFHTLLNSPVQLLNQCRSQSDWTYSMGPFYGPYWHYFFVAGITKASVAKGFKLGPRAAKNEKHWAPHLIKGCCQIRTDVNWADKVVEDQMNVIDKSIETIESQSNAIEYYPEIGHSIEIRLRSTIELQLFDRIRLRSIGSIAIFVRTCSIDTVVWLCSKRFSSLKFEHSFSKIYCHARAQASTFKIKPAKLKVKHLQNPEKKKTTKKPA